MNELIIEYTNYRGETAIRKIRPIEFRLGSTEWHPEPQWLLKAIDTERNVEREGCTELTVVNLYALRATNPKDLLDCINVDVASAIGGDKQSTHLCREIEEHSNLNHKIVCAWGKQKGIEDQVSKVRELISLKGGSPLCLGKTKEGFPRHPLYVRGDKELEEL